MANVLLRELLVEWVNKGNLELLVMRWFKGITLFWVGLSTFWFIDFGESFDLSDFAGPPGTTGPHGSSWTKRWKGISINVLHIQKKCISCFNAFSIVVMLQLNISTRCWLLSAGGAGRWWESRRSSWSSGWHCKSSLAFLSPSLFAVKLSNIN